MSTVDLGVKLDLKQIALRARNAEYNPKRFTAAVIMRIREPKATALAFGTGKLVCLSPRDSGSSQVCTGTKSERLAKEASRKFAAIIKRIGFAVKFNDFKVVNIVASCDIRYTRVGKVSFD